MKKTLRSLLCGAAALTFCASCALSYAAVVDKVVVVVNEEVVTQREFNRAFLPIQKSYEANFKGDELQRRLQMAREGLLEQLVNSKLAISLAKKEKVKIDEAELTKRIDSVKSYYGSEEEFLKALNEKGTNLTEFEREMRDQILAQALVEQEVGSKIVIAPGDVRELYEKNKDKLISPDQVKVRGIMVRREAEGEDPENKKKMQAIVSELKKGKDFASVATERSEGPYAKNGGDMGYISKGQTLAEIDEVVFSLKEGERSDIVETGIGYHVFLIEEVKPARPLEFKEVSDFLREQLYMKKFQESLIAWLEEKRKNAYISFK